MGFVQKLAFCQIYMLTSVRCVKIYCAMTSLCSLFAWSRCARKPTSTFFRKLIDNFTRINKMVIINFNSNSMSRYCMCGLYIVFQYTDTNMFTKSTDNRLDNFSNICDYRIGLATIIAQSRSTAYNINFLHCLPRISRLECHDMCTCKKYPFEWVCSNTSSYHGHQSRLISLRASLQFTRISYHITWRRSR